jgi:hypothetical protein
VNYDHGIWYGDTLKYHWTPGGLLQYTIQGSHSDDDDNNDSSLLGYGVLLTGS